MASGVAPITNAQIVVAIKLQPSSIGEGLDRHIGGCIKDMQLVCAVGDKHRACQPVVLGLT